MDATNAYVSKNPFNSKGIWLKGNLHTHTTKSDGKLSPLEVIDFYSKAGYDFLAITDHEKITRIKSSRISLISGIETSTSRGENGHSYHVVILGMEDNDEIQSRRNSIQDLLDYVNENGYLAFIAHPYWSSLTTRDLKEVDGYIGIEVYNTGCDVEVGKGYSTVHWDNVLASGREILGFAVDDAHRYTIPPIDTLGGWINVKSEDSSSEYILEAIKNGAFYASTGPVIYDFNYFSNTIEASFTPVARVDIISKGGIGLSISEKLLKTIELNERYWKSNFKGYLKNIEIERENSFEKIYFVIGKMKVALIKDTKGITGIRIESHSLRKYFRLEITDKDYGKAWSNPVLI